MSKEIKEIDKILQKMRTNDYKSKGDAGEEAVFKILSSIIAKYPGLLYWSYWYPGYDTYPGNIRVNEELPYKEGHPMFKRFELSNMGTELDILFVTDFRVFPIEVKSYSADKIILTDYEMLGTLAKGKSPIHQNEMHCRHLYPIIFPALPGGKVEYICPIVVFVDKGTLLDNRSDEQKEYIKASVLNELLACIKENNKPLEYRLDLETIDKLLMDASSVDKVKRRVVNFGKEYK